MKILFKKVGKKQWHSRLCKGKGGVSSCVTARQGNFLFALKIFSLRNILKTIR